LKLNEHMSKKLLARCGVFVPQGEIVPPEQVDSFQPGFSLPWMVKAMVLSGGRGKAGGIKKVRVPEEFAPTARQILAMNIKGEGVPFVRVEPVLDIQREMYVSLTLDRARKNLVLSIGRSGGVEIESTGRENFLFLDIDPLLGLQNYQIRQGFFHLGLAREVFTPWSALLENLYKGVMKNHLLLAEINPLVLTRDGQLTALDGKVEMDDNYVAINRDLDRYYVPEHFGFQENAARQAGFSYHKLQGRVGLLVNGAGLAMATMDLLNFSGVPAANFLDLGGGADQERISRALDLIFSDARAECIFINVFGGILSCEKVALALDRLLDGRNAPKPMVVRFSGFRAQEAGKVIDSLKAGNVYFVSDLDRALDRLKELSPLPQGGVQFERIEFPRVSSYGRSGSESQVRPLPLHKNTRVLVQGITGREGTLHTREMLAYGTRIVAGVTPFKGGERVLDIPVYNSVDQACQKHAPDASIVFVPGPLAADAVLEAVACSIPWIVCITEGIPQQDMVRILSVIRKSPSRLVGPNTPGVMVPGQTKIGIMPGSIFSQGPMAVLSRSGTLTYECVHALSTAGIGQCLCLGIGGDPFVGQDFRDFCSMLHEDPICRALLVLGEIGGTAEEELGLELNRIGFNKPVLGFVAGQTAPPGKRLGHAGAILDEQSGGIKSKLTAMHEAGITICPDLNSIPGLAETAMEA